MVKKPKQGLKKLGRDQFIQNILTEVNKKGYKEVRLKKNGDVSSVDVKNALGSVLFEFIVFSESDGSERVRIAKRKGEKKCPDQKRAHQIS